MKTKNGFILLLVMLIFALALVNCSPPAASASSIFGAASFSAQAAPALQEEDKSEIGSTDGIFIMGIVIVAITSLPLFFHKKNK